MLDKCLNCSESANEVLDCTISDCPLYPIRLNQAKVYDKDDILHFKKKCLECCGGQMEEVKQCPVAGCPLHRFRDQYWENKKDQGN